MLGTRIAARVAAGLVVGFLTLGALAPVAGAASNTLALDTAVVLTTPGVVLTIPHDGRIRGYEFSAQVTGAAFTYTAGAGYDTVSAPAGDFLCVFSLAVTDFNQNGAGASIPDFAGLAVVGDRTIPLDVSSLTTGGSVTYAVSVPRRAPVSLELAGEELSQGYSLSRLALEAPVPAVLYRDPAAPHVSLDLADNDNAAVSTPDGSVNGGSVPLDLDGASLSYFSPDANLVPPGGPGDAYLVLGLSSPDDGDITANSSQGQIALDDFTTLTPGEVSLVLPGGTTIAAQHTGPTSIPWGDVGDSGLIEGTYYFQVPADITTANVVVDPQPNEVTGTYAVETGTITVDIAKTTFPLSFPPPVAMGPPGPALSIPAVPAALHLPLGVGGGDDLWLVVVIVILAVLLGLAGGLYLRRRRIQHVRSGAPLYVAWTPGGRSRGPERSILYARYEHRPDGRDLEVVAPGVIDLRAGATPWALPAAPASRRLVVRLLGPAGIDGMTEGYPPRLEHMVLALALAYPGSVKVDELRNLLGSDYREKDRLSLRNDMSRLRHHLPEGVLPWGRIGQGYRLAGDITVDWFEFTRLIREARGVPTGEAHRLQVEALELVVGVPLAYIDCDGLAGRGAKLAEAVEDVAVGLAEVALAGGNVDLAEFATERGLRAQPESGKLWELRFRAGMAGSNLGVHGVWAKAQTILGEAGAERLRPYYERLRASI